MARGPGFGALGKNFIIVDTEQVTSAGEHAMNLSIGRVFLREKHYAELAHDSVEGSVRERKRGSVGRKATSSPGLNFVRATPSIGALRSVAVRCTPGGRKLRNWRVTIPVPAAVSSTRAGLQAAARRAMSAA